MLKLAFIGLFIALLMVGFQVYSPEFSKLKQLQEANQALSQQVTELQTQLELSELEQARLREALAKHDAAKIKRLYD